MTGPDGALWFTTGDAIGRITTNGQVTHYLLPNGANDADQITVGPDGALWFTDPLDRLIGQITTSWQFTTYSPPFSTRPAGIVSGPDGNLWVTEENTQHIARITTNGVCTEFSTQTPSDFVADPDVGIIVGTDGNMYFSEN